MFKNLFSVRTSYTTYTKRIKLLIFDECRRCQEPTINISLNRNARQILPFAIKTHSQINLFAAEAEYLHIGFSDNILWASSPRYFYENTYTTCIVYYNILSIHIFGIANELLFISHVNEFAFRRRVNIKLFLSALACAKNGKDELVHLDFCFFASLFLPMRMQQLV